ncbi:hypothetical protein ABEB36_014129 [Hypothenemus hampei]|uniref:Integrase catalytic domain-containing protein n=1 Tax=Hypothenemus hampei TaxID=57062 RepID=A0ABD1E488_HYPHA
MDDLIDYYFRLGYQHQEILLYLLQHGISLSIRSLKRQLKRLNCYRRKNYTSIEEISNFLNEQMMTSGMLLGYKWMHRRCILNGFIVKQQTVRRLLYIIDPVGVESRRRRLSRRQYYNKGPNYLWHIDGYDKLTPYGICISGCIDGFSRKILWARAAHTNRNPMVIAGYFLEVVNELYGFPQTIRTDMGTENTVIETLQKLSNEITNSENHTLPPPPLSTVLVTQTNELRLGGQCFEDITYCFMDTIQTELNEFVLEWNNHSIRQTRHSIAPSGRPETMYTFPEVYDTQNYLVSIDPDLINIEEFEEVCEFLSIPSADEDVFELCNIISEEMQLQKPENPYDAMTNYVLLRREIIPQLV